MIRTTSHRDPSQRSGDPIIILNDITDRISNIAVSDTHEDADSAPERTLESTWEVRVRALLSDRYSGDTRARKHLAYSTQWFIGVWLFFIIVILTCNEALFYLSDAVLITLLGTTTATVLGLALIVLNGFFRHMNQNVDLRDRQNQ
jgi:hypothetical protein